jgi:penicillin-binding protein 1A
MMQRVVTQGTARRMIYEFGFNDVEMAAKTGTTNDNVDAWFMCAVPNLVMGVWVGGEEPSVHFTSSADGSRMALPVAGKFLSKVYSDGTLGVLRTDRFERSAELPDYNCDGSESVSDEQSYDDTTSSSSDDEFFD